MRKQGLLDPKAESFRDHEAKPWRITWTRGTAIWLLRVSHRQTCRPVLRRRLNIPDAPFFAGGIAGIAQTTVRVLPNWDVLVTGYSHAGLSDSSGQFIRGWGISVFVSSGNFSSSLDPDGTSFWTGGAWVTQVDLNSSQALQQWAAKSSTHWRELDS